MSLFLYQPDSSLIKAVFQTETLQFVNQFSFRYGESCARDSPEKEDTKHDFPWEDEINRFAG